MLMLPLLPLNMRCQESSGSVTYFQAKCQVSRFLSVFTPTFADRVFSSFFLVLQMLDATGDPHTPTTKLSCTNDLNPFRVSFWCAELKANAALSTNVGVVVPCTPSPTLVDFYTPEIMEVLENDNSGAGHHFVSFSQFGVDTNSQLVLSDIWRRATEFSLKKQKPTFFFFALQFSSSFVLAHGTATALPLVTSSVSEKQAPSGLHCVCDVKMNEFLLDAQCTDRQTQRERDLGGRALISSVYSNIRSQALFHCSLCLRVKELEPTDPQAKDQRAESCLHF